LESLQLKNSENEEMLALIRDPKNTIIPLAGQEVSPNSFAKVYWNQETQSVYIDGAGLPEPPEGYVYQVWALKLNPLTPLSIGLLDNFKGQSKRIFEVENVGDAEAFGITLEPAGGSASPTLEQLYTLGKV
jgi:anti-sigma-K factor RskA